MSSDPKTRLLSAIGIGDPPVSMPNVFAGYADHYLRLLESWDIVALRVFVTADSPAVPLIVRNKTQCTKEMSLRLYCQKEGCEFDTTPRVRAFGVRDMLSNQSIFFDLDGLGPSQRKALILAATSGKFLVANDAVQTISWLSHACEENLTLGDIFIVDPLLYTRMFFSRRVHMPEIAEAPMCYLLNAEIPDHLVQPYCWMPEFLSADHFQLAKSLLESTDIMMRWVADGHFSKTNMLALKSHDYALDADAYMKGVIDIHLRGLPLHEQNLKLLLTRNIDACEKALNEILEEIPELEEFRNKMSNPDFAPDKHFQKKFPEILLERYQSTVTRFGTSDLKQAGVPIADAWERYLTAGHRYSYFASFADFKMHGCLYPMYSINAVTGRISSRYPNILSKPNLPEADAVVQPREGHVHIKLDYSQIEIRTAAAIAHRFYQSHKLGIPQDGLIAALKAGADLHHITALAITGTKSPVMAYLNGARATASDRESAKPLNFGLLYGIGDESLIKNCRDDYGITLTVADTTFFRATWYETFPELKVWHESVRAAKKNNLWVVWTLAGRPIIAKTVTAAYNYACQGSGADMVARAFRYFANAGIRDAVAGTRFDEFTLEARDGSEEALLRVAQTCMHNAAADFLGPFDIPVGPIEPVYQRRVQA